MNFHDFNTISIIEKDSNRWKNKRQKNRIQENYMLFCWSDHCTSRSWSWKMLKLWAAEIKTLAQNKLDMTQSCPAQHLQCKYVQIILKWLANHVKLEFWDENRLKKYHMWLFAPHSERQDVARNALTWDLDNWGLERQTGRQQGISIFQPRYPLEVFFLNPGWKNEMKKLESSELWNKTYKSPINLGDFGRFFFATLVGTNQTNQENHFCLFSPGLPGLVAWK